MKRLPAISIIIPAHNEEKTIYLALDSIKKQDYKGNLETIVADNGSTDKTVQIAKKYGVKIISIPEKGVAIARQTGFMAAKGQIIATTDADTILPVNWLSRIEAEFSKRPDAVMVSGMYTFYDGSWFLNSLTRLLNYHLFALFNWYSGTNMAVKRDAFMKIGGFDTTLPLSEDSDLGVRLRKIGKVHRFNHLKVSTSGRRFNQLGIIGGLLSYTVAYIKFKLHIKTELGNFKAGSEIPKLGLFPKLAIHFVVITTLSFLILGGGFEIKPVRAQVLKREHQLRHELQYQFSKIDVDMPSINTHNLPHVHYYR